MRSSAGGRLVLLLVILASLRAAHLAAAPGDLDPTFGVDPLWGPGPLGPGMVLIDDEISPLGYVNANGLALQADGRIIVVVGEGTRIRRHLVSGLPDPSFGGGGSVAVGPFREIRDVAVQGNGAIVGVGFAYQPLSAADHYASIVRLLPDGTVDPAFGTAGIVDAPEGWQEELLATVLQEDGTIVAAGRIRGVKERLIVRRWLAGGAADPAFGSRGRVRRRLDRDGGLVHDLVARPGGGLIAVGQSHNKAGVFDAFLGGLLVDGRRDRTLGRRWPLHTHLGFLDDAAAAVLQGDGKLVVAGTTADTAGGEERFLVLRYLMDGSLDPAFGVGGVVTTGFGDDGAEGYGVALQADGKIVVAGGAEPDVALARYLLDGSLDPTFGVGGLVRTPIVLPGVDHAEALAVVVQADGDIVVAGVACPIASECDDHFLARYQGS